MAAARHSPGQPCLWQGPWQVPWQGRPTAGLRPTLRPVRPCRALLWSLALAGCVALGSAGCGGGTAGTKVFVRTVDEKRACSQIAVESDSNQGCPGLGPKGTTPETSNLAPLEVRAVYYVPRMVGEVPGHVDLYSDHLRRVHERDLYIISKVLKANTIRLEPWDLTNDHSGFMELCKKYGLFVIPTFDFKYFFDHPDWRDRAFSDRRKAIVGKFDTFLLSVRREDPVLAWSLNHALKLNETVQNGALSMSESNAVRDHYFALLGAIRTVHMTREWDTPASPKAFARPLALPLSIDTQLKPQDLFWYVGLTETVWGKWPTEGIHDPALVEKLSAFGAFDMWIADTLPPSTADGVNSTKADLQEFNQPPASKDFPKCAGQSGCTYRTKKATLLQFGFGVLQPGELLKLSPDVQVQQEYLKSVWQAVSTDRCVAGGIIDEWVDDWDRCGLRGYTSLPYQQNKGGLCDEVRPGQLVHVEWFGLNSQYSFFGHHCIDPRFHQQGGFRFEETGDDSHLWKQGPGLCQLLMPSPWDMWKLGGAAALVVAIWVFRLVRCCRSKPSEQTLVCEDEDSCGGGSSRHQPLRLMTADEVTWRDSLVAPLSQSQLRVSYQAEPELPSEVSRGLPNESRRFVVELQAFARADPNVRFSTAQANLFLKAHLHAQTKRLRHQLECEALAVHSRGDVARELHECYGRAMRNIHARVMEGYAAWLETQPASQDKVDAVTGQVDREPWELYVEALLLRLIESLAEHALHSPEFIAAVFDDVRWRGVETANLPEKPHFVIDHNLLRTGLDELKKNADPYHGGVNFDDINDCGRAGNPGEVTKTYQESASLLVILDVISNFFPVFLIKFWLMFLAWYMHLGNDARNGTPWKPKFRRSQALQLFVLLDCSLCSVLEACMLVHGISQTRGSCTGRCCWLSRRLVSFLVTLPCFLVMWVVSDFEPIDWSIRLEDIPVNYPPKEKRALMCAAAIIAVRVLLLYGTTRPRKSVPYIPGRPRSRKEVHEDPAEPQPLTASAPLLLSGNEDSFSCAPVVPPRDPESARSPRSPAPRTSTLTTGTQGAGSCAGVAEISASNVRLLREAAWFVMLGSCFLFEMHFIVPLAADLDWPRFCEDTCTVRHLPFKHVGSDCFACAGTLGMVWILVLLTVMFDIYYIFYAGTAVFGYAMGEWRGLRNVLSAALRHLDFETGRPQQAAQAAGHQVSDGEAMRRVFGRSWRMVWSRIVEALYEDCLITDADAERMVLAAGTVRWLDQHGTSTDFAKPADRFSKVRFTVLETRSGVACESAAGAKHRCIYQLHVRPTQHVEAFPLGPFPDAAVELTLEGSDEVEELLAALGQDLVVPPSGVALGSRLEKLEPGCRLVACGGFHHGSREDFQELLQNTTFPVDVVFARAGQSFEHVTVDLKEPCRVHAVSFTTGVDDPSLDPVRWSVEGYAEGPDGTGSWKQLVLQERPYEPPRTRKMHLGVEFGVEYWRRRESPENPRTLNLDQFLPSVHERLGFFAASLKGLLRTRAKHQIREGIDTLVDSHVGNIPMLTQIIPCYQENVILAEQYLRESDGVNTNLAFIISQFPEEWAIFAKKMQYAPDDLYRAYMEGETALLPTGLQMEIRLWASMRSQTVAKTVVGAIQYHEVIAMLPNVYTADDKTAAMHHCVELLLAHQTYGSINGSEANDADIRYLLGKFKNRPFYLVFDFDSKTARDATMLAVHKFAKERYKFEGRVRYASVLARFKQSFTVSGSSVPEDALEIIEVLPRCYPLRIGTEGFMTQGKAGNQLGALRFSRGHVLQMMDANMGAFFGEACKVPFVLRRFQPSWADRTSVQARIIGFREFIFTEHHGMVGSVMASAEWSFGTICQRFLSGLGARMHYGHPDFLDGFWASNRGSLSKASPVINLSEDIFAGFNVMMRGEKSVHVDALAWEKGRESSFNAAALFYTKVSKGNVGVMRSRDLKIITENLNVVDTFSFYFASVGFYLNNLLIDFSLAVYVGTFILLTLSSKSLDDVASLDSMLATEWMLSLGIIAMFPRFMELTLERGPLEGVMRFLPSIPGCMAMFTFINKSIASGVRDTMVTGEANYIATGRPNANTHYSWRECYFLHCSSHYYPAIHVWVCYLLYRLVAENHGFSSLPMMVVLASSALWVIAPILFCPQPTLRSLGNDLSEFWQFIIVTPSWSLRTLLGSTSDTSSTIRRTEELLRTKMDDPRSTLYDFWLAEALLHKRAPLTRRVCGLIAEVVRLAIGAGILYSTMLDNIWSVVVLFAIHFVLMELWRVLNRPTVLTLVTMFLWLVLPPLMWPGMAYVNLLVVFIIVIFALRVVREAVLLLVWLYLRPNAKWQSMPEGTEEERALKQVKAKNALRYDMVVEYLFVNLMGHHIHLYCAVLILVINLVVQSILVGLDLLFGLHSWTLLNPRLRGPGCCARRRGYQPSSHAIKVE